ncbi:MAG: PepSY domain-containing protein, partial [Nitrospira sp.]|nr:PepSY domain-containing protein [Nitrospira sp.]
NPPSRAHPRRADEWKRSRIKLADAPTLGRPEAEFLQDLSVPLLDLQTLTPLLSPASLFLRVSCFDQTVVGLLPMLEDGCSVAGQHAKPGKTLEVNVGKDDGRVVYKGEIVDGKKTYEVYVDAITGKVHEIK